MTKAYYEVQLKHAQKEKAICLQALKECNFDNEQEVFVAQLIVDKANLIDYYNDQLKKYE